MRTTALASYPYLEMSGSPLRSRIDFSGTGLIPASPLTTNFLSCKVPPNVIVEYLNKMNPSGGLGQARLFGPSPEGRETLKRREGNGWKLMASDGTGPSSDALMELLDRARQAGDRRSLKQWMDQILPLAQAGSLSVDARDEIVRLLTTRFLKEFIHITLDILDDHLTSVNFPGEFIFPETLSPLSQLLSDFRTSIRDVGFQDRRESGDPILREHIDFLLEFPISSDPIKWWEDCVKLHAKMSDASSELTDESTDLDPLAYLALLAVGVFGVFHGWTQGNAESVTQIFQEQLASCEGKLPVPQNWGLLAHIHYMLAQCLGVISFRFEQPRFEEALKSLEKSCEFRETFAPQDSIPFREIAYVHIIFGYYQGPKAVRHQWQKAMRLFEKHGFTQEYRITKKHIQTMRRLNKEDMDLIAKLKIHEALEGILGLPETETDAISENLESISFLLRMDEDDLKNQIYIGQGRAVDIIKSLISTQKFEDLREKLFPNTSN